MRKGLSAMLCVLMVAGAAQATTILINDSFNYANQAAFQAVWAQDSTTAPVTLSSEQAFSPTMSVKASTTAMRSSQVIAETAASAAEPIVFKFRYYDSGGAAYRQYAELIDAAGTGNGQIIAMGLNNNLTSSYYMARIVGFNGSAFFRLDDAGAPARSVGWHLLEAEITPTAVKFSVDGVLSKTADISSFVVRSYDKVRLGSNLSSGNVAYFDDVYLAKLPEPSALVLLLAGMPLLRRRRGA